MFSSLTLDKNELQQGQHAEYIGMDDVENAYTNDA